MPSHILWLKHNIHKKNQLQGYLRLTRFTSYRNLYLNLKYTILLWKKKLKCLKKAWFSSNQLINWSKPSTNYEKSQTARNIHGDVKLPYKAIWLFLLSKLLTFSNHHSVTLIYSLVLCRDRHRQTDARWKTDNQNLHYDKSFKAMVHTPLHK